MSNDINNNNWIEAIKNKAQQATKDVPSGTWEAIAKDLNQHQAAPVKHNRGQIATWIWKASAAAAAVALLITTAFFVLNDDPQQQQQLAKVEKPTSPAQDVQSTDTTQATQPSQPIPAPAAVPNVAPATTPMLAKNNTPKTHTTSSPSATIERPKKHHRNNDEAKPLNNRHNDEEQFMNELMAISNNEIIDLSDYPNEFNPEDYFYDIETMQALEELYSQYDNAMNQEAMEPWKAYTDSTYQQHLVYDANARRAAREKMALTKRHKKPTMLLAAYGNGLISTDHNSTINSSTAQMLLPQPSGNQSGMMLAPAAPGITPRVSPPVNYNYHHHMPLTAGITFNKRIVGNLYGSVGFNFTSMSSDVTPDNGTGEFKQKVMLVGLPFGVKWNFWRYRGLSTFVGGEALVEKGVSAKFNNDNVTIKRLQWSVHATAGLQYNFNRYVGVYLAPKLSHYITTMPLNTIRNEHPLNFNLQLGLSFDF